MSIGIVDVQKPQIPRIDASVPNHFALQKPRIQMNAIRSGIRKSMRVLRGSLKRSLANTGQQDKSIHRNSKCGCNIVCEKKLIGGDVEPILTREIDVFATMNDNKPVLVLTSQQALQRPDKIS